MKKYYSIGELFADYRKMRQMTQGDFASDLDVDVRTVQRWENGTTLIKPEKEEDIVTMTFLPYQLIRNLNAVVPLPTYYDFNLRKYSLDAIDKDLPSAKWQKKRLEMISERIRSVDFEMDFKYLENYLKFYKKCTPNMREVIKKASELLPEMNLIITDVAGYYAGHSLIFPIRPETYEKLRSKEMHESELTVDDLVPHRTLERPMFFGFDITANSNENYFYISSALMRFLRDKPNQNYWYCAIPFRKDNRKLSSQLGLKIVWEEEPSVNEYGIEMHRRFQEGNLRDFLQDVRD